MKTVKKIIITLLVLILSIIILGNNVDAASVSIRASASKITTGNNVSVTVSFGEKVSAAQFKLNYDKSKFDYVSCSAGNYGTTGTYVYMSYEDVKDLGSVTFTFKSKATGSGAFSISGVVLSSSASISSSSTTVTVENAKTTTTPSKKPTTPSKKPTTNNNKDDKEEENQEPEVIEKSELDNFKREIANLVQGDYTEESWNALQEAIAKAENAGSNEEYDSVKGELRTDKLVPVQFSKDELNKVLRALLGKVEKDYTEESWTALQDAIDMAEEAKLKSEYDLIKDELTVNSLILAEKGPLEGFIEMMDDMGSFALILIAIIIVLAIIVLILLVICLKSRHRGAPGKRFE